MNKRCYIVLHGINTDHHEAKQLRNNVAKVIGERETDPIIYDGSYGYIPTFALAIPFIGKLLHRPIITMTKNLIERCCVQYREVVILAHSNGTHVALRAIEQSDKYYDNILAAFFGGTIKCSYDFRKVHWKLKMLLNFCSTKDKVIHFLPKLIGRGSSGYYGFRHRSLDFSQGEKAKQDNIKEPVWVPVGNDSRFPYVVNFHFNKCSHNDWLNDPMYLNMVLNEFSKVNKLFI